MKFSWKSSYGFVVLLVGLWMFQDVHAFAGNAMSAFRLTKPTFQPKKMQLDMRWGLKSPQTGISQDGKLLRDSVPFELRGFSLPLVVFSAGAILTASSFAGFFINEGGSDGAVSSLGFVYGIPVFLIGLSLWYAEIAPVPVYSDAEGDAAWEKYSTDTFQKIKKVCTLLCINSCYWVVDLVHAVCKEARVRRACY